MRAFKAQIQSFRGMKGDLVSLGSGTLLQACFIASFIQEVVFALTVENVLRAERDLKPVGAFDASITYKTLIRETPFDVCTFPEDSLNKTQAQRYG